MIDISKKKLPNPAIAAIVYVSYCAMSWFGARGTLAFYGQQYGLPGWFINDAWAFFIGGLVPFLLYELFTLLVFRALPMRTGGGNIKSVRYGLNYAVIAANVLLFALKFMYMAIPLYAPIIDIIIDPVVTILFVALYMWYVFGMNYVEKSRFKTVLVQVLGTFLALYGLLAIINMIVVVA